MVESEHDPLSIIDLFSLMSPLDAGEDEHSDTLALATPHIYGISPEDKDNEEPGAAI